MSGIKSTFTTVIVPERKVGVRVAPLQNKISPKEQIKNEMAYDKVENVTKRPEEVSALFSCLAGLHRHIPQKYSPAISNT